MSLVTSKELIEMIQEQDPEGKRPVIIRVEDFDECDIELHDISLELKDGYPTDEGDRDVLRIYIKL